MPIINEALCNQCHTCVDVCENDIFVVVDSKVAVVNGKCAYCQECVEQCEPGAIKFEE